MTKLTKLLQKSKKGEHMEEIRNLNNLNRGVHKQWIWGNKDNYYRSCDYFQKINYCIQDLNAEIKNLSEPTMKEVVYIIALIDWICEAVEAIPKILKSGVMNNYIYKKDECVLQSIKFFKAIRSFVVAHPLSTDRHKEYGFDGDMICIDIRTKTSIITKTFSHNSDWFHLDFDGLKKEAKEQDADFVLYVYSQKADGMQLFKYIGADFQDLYHVAELHIEKLYDLDKYLGKLKRKDSEVQ